MSRVKATLESTAGISPSELKSLHALLVRPYQSLDDVERAVRNVFPDWFLYRGGSHVSLQERRYTSEEGFSERLALWTEEKPEAAPAPIVHAERQMPELADPEDMAADLEEVRENCDAAIEAAYASGRKAASVEHGADRKALEDAERYTMRKLREAYLEGFTDQVDEWREAALEDAAECPEG